MTALHDSRLVAVFGANGTIGSAVVRQLAGQLGVRVMLRKPPEDPLPHHVSAVIVDYRSVTHLSRGMAGADTLFVGIGTTPELASIEGRIIEAARQSGLQRIIRISAPSVPGVAVSEWHGKVEAMLRDSGIAHQNIRPSAFMQNWLRHADPIRYRGMIVGSAGMGARNYVDARDVAAVAVRAILREDPPDEQVLSVTGPEAISHPDMAERISFVSGRFVVYQDVSPAEQLAQLKQRARLPDWLAHHVVELDGSARDYPEQGTNAIRTLLGRPARTMDEFLTEHRNAFMRPRLMRFV